jgi:hypothetical protein
VRCKPVRHLLVAEVIFEKGPPIKKKR